MFCCECGQPASGKFCSHCGHKLPAAETLAVVRMEQAPPMQIDWEHEVNYETLLSSAEVRKAIDASSAKATKRMSGEQFLALADKIVPMGVSMEGLAGVIAPLSGKLGIKTGKDRAEQIDAPIGRVIVRALCSLAEHGQSIRQVHQDTDGCTLQAALPSDLISFEGDLVVSLRRLPRGSEVRATTKITGQFFDWGKSRRALDRLFDDLRVKYARTA